jgi:hypothetical protein
MGTRRVSARNTTALYIIAIVVIIVFFLLLGGGAWLKGVSHAGRSMGLVHWNWVQILISIGIGFLLGILASKRKWRF